MVGGVVEETKEALSWRGRKDAQTAPATKSIVWLT
jgi:hypothetical protein